MKLNDIVADEKHGNGLLGLLIFLLVVGVTVGSVYLAKNSGDMAEGIKNYIGSFCTAVSENKNSMTVFKNSLRIGEYGIEPGVAGKFFRTEVVNKNRIRFNTELSVSEDVLFNFNFITYADNVLLSSEKFYTVTGTHSLMFYNEKNLAGQVEFVNQVRKILSIYPDNSDKQLLEDKFIINAMTIFIDRYFGPLWLNGTYSLNKASKLMKTTIEDNKFSKAFNSSRLDYSIGNRYVVFRKLLRLKQYKLCLIYNRIMDKIKGYERFRKD